MTVDEFGDFELRLEWKLAKGGNSGIMFHVTKEGEAAWRVRAGVPGPRQRRPQGRRRIRLTSAGSNYAVHAPVRDVTKPFGEWNAVRLSSTARTSSTG